MSIIIVPDLWERRKAEKAASRAEDARAIAAGEKTAEEVTRENFAFNIDWVQSLEVDFFNRVFKPRNQSR